MKKYQKALHNLIRFYNSKKCSRPLKNIYSDDVFIIGYPKSGNSWVRFLIGNYLTGNNCDFKNNHLIIPGIVEHRDECNRLKRPRFMHTHWTYDKFMANFSVTKKMKNKIIFIVRDGRDVAVSYFYHLKKFSQIDIQTKFEDYLEFFNRGEIYPLQKWGHYINEWIDENLHNENFLILRYENLKEHTESELGLVLRFVELMTDTDKIHSAIAASDFNRMKDLETLQQDYHSRLKDSDKRIRFIRQGKINQWKKYFNRKQLEQFNQIHGEALRKLGYPS